LKDANRTKDSIMNCLHRLPHNSPFRKSLISIISPNYKSQEDIVKDTKFSRSLVSRAKNLKVEQCLLRNLMYKPNTKRPHISTTENLQLAYQYLDEKIPMNSAHARVTTNNLTTIYQDFIDTLPKETLVPLGPAYFRKLVMQMKIKRVKKILQCKYCFELKKLHLLDEKKLQKCLFTNIFSCNNVLT
jgi:hypothetical protein